MSTRTQLPAREGVQLTADESIISFIMQRGFHPRLGARPLRDAIEKHLRDAIADAMLAGVGASFAEFVICGNELLIGLYSNPEVAPYAPRRPFVSS